MKVNNINSCAIVKKYSVIEKDGKKYVALRIKNALTEPITGFDIKVRQYDKNGRPVGTVVLSTTTLKEEDADFVWVSKTPMSDKCDHIETEIKRVCYGDYTYTRKGDGVTLSYTDRAERAKAARAFYLKSGDGKSQVLTHNYVKHAVGVGVLSIVLILIALAVCVLQIIVFRNTAEEFAFQGVIYRFADEEKKDDTDIIVTGFNGRYKDVTIPEKIEGHRVAEISAKAFTGSPYIHTLTIESSTLEVPSGAFKDCNNLKSVKLIGIANVGANAFFNCKNLKSVELKGVKAVGESAFMRTGITSVDLSASENVKIGEHAFSYCVDLASVKLSDTVEFDGAGNAFTDSNVKTVEFDTLSTDISFVSVFGRENVVESISAAKLERVPALFCEGMNSLKSFKIAELTDKNIGAGAFRDLASLEEFDVGGAVTSIGAGAFYGCGIKYIDLSNIKEIDEYSFYNCRGLTDVTFSTELESIGDYAFYGCVSLKKAVLPHATKTVGAHAFEKCSALVDISLNDSIESVGESAFEESGITKIAFPDSIRIISRGALKNTKSLVELKTPHFFTRDNPGTLSDMFGGFVPSALARVQVTMSSSVSGQELRGLNRVKEFILPDDLTVIAEYAFAGCTALEKINLPTALTGISAYAFSGCSSLKNISFPSLLTWIGEYAFAGCSSVQEIIVNKGIEVAPCAFSGMSGLRSLTTYTFEVSTGETGLFRLFTTENGDVPTSLEAVTVLDVDEIPEYAFSRLTSVKSIVFPLNIPEISDYAFAYCNSLERLVLPNTLTRIGTKAFLDCSSLEMLNFPTGLETIEHAAFENSGITKLTVPQSTNLKSGALLGMNRLSSLTLNDIVSEGNTVSLVSLFGGRAVASLKTLEVSNLSAILPSSFFGFSGLETLRFEGTPSSIGESAFEGCSSLKSVSIPSTVTSIGARAFFDCSSLTSIAIPSGVTEIAAHTFDGCGSLATVSLSSEITAIGAYAFGGCVSLESLTLPSSLTSLGEYAFSECKFEKLVIPDNTKFAFSALSGLNRLKEVSVPSTRTTAGTEKFIYLFGGSVPVTLETVTLTNADSVPDNAFEFSNYIKTVKIYDGAAFVGNNAFNSCSSLASVEIPDSVTRIGNGAFSFCGELSSIKLPSALTAIGDSAFLGCYKLYTVYNFSRLTLTRGSTGYGYVAYYALKISSNLSDKLTLIKKDDLGFARDDGGSWHLIEYYGDGGALTLPDTFTVGEFTVSSYSIAPRLFRGIGITELTVSKAVRKIGEYAFANCIYLQTVSFESGGDVTLSDGVFYGNENLGAVTFGANVKLDAGSAEIFYNCRALTSIKLPDEMRTIGESMFAGCLSLEEVKLPSKLEAIRMNAFLNCDLITEIILPSTLNSIESNAFLGCYKLYSVCNLSRSLSITVGGSNYGAVAQYAIKVSSDEQEHTRSVTVVDGYKFILSDSGYYLVDADKADLVLDAKPGVSSYSIAHHAFMNSSVVSVIMSGAVKSVGEYAFYYSSLRTLSIGENVTSIGEKAFYGFGIDTLVIRAVRFTSTNAFTSANAVYYKGTHDDWRNLSLNFSYGRLRVYAECVHSSDEWTEIDGVISIEVPPTVTEVTKEATCTETGTRTTKCSRCGETIKSETIPQKDHEFDIDGKCTECGAIKTVQNVTSENLHTLFAVKYFEWEGDSIVSTAEYSETATLTFTADKDMIISLNVALTVSSGARFRVSIGGVVALEMTSGSRKFEHAISKGAEVIISFYNNNPNEASCSIDGLSLSYITPSEVSK